LKIFQFAISRLFFQQLYGITIVIVIIAISAVVVSLLVQATAAAAAAAATATATVWNGGGCNHRSATGSNSSANDK